MEGKRRRARADADAGRGDAAGAWALARRQHGVVARRQLLDLGYSRSGIERRLRSGRLHPVRRGVYAVGRPGLTERGLWMAAGSREWDGAVLLLLDRRTFRLTRSDLEQLFLRDQAHTASGLSHLRFTHEQVKFEQDHVLVTLRATARLLLAGVSSSGVGETNPEA